MSALALAALLAAPAAAAPAPKRPNVVLIVVDALSARHLGAYGYRRATSPRLDALAAEGALFETVVAPSNWTLPSLASLLTGLLPSAHGALLPPAAKDWAAKLEAGRLVPGPGERLEASRPTVARRLAAAGYRTAAVVSGGFCRSAFGFGRGFHEYHDLGGLAEHIEPTYLPLLEKERGRPFFLYIHLSDVHDPYQAPAPYGKKWADPAYRGPMDGSRAALRVLQHELCAGRGDPADLAQAEALYDGGVSYADAAIGRLLDRLAAAGLADDTAVFVTADHGEGFGSRKLLRHGSGFSDEVLLVPLLVRAPGLPRGLRVGGQVRALDVAPTILELAGLAPAPMQGRSLLGALRGGPAPDLEAVSQTDDGSALRAGGWKLVRFNEQPPSLYDLAADPGERRDLAAERPEVVARLGARLDALEGEARALAKRLPALPARRVRPNMRERLKAAGYVD